MIQSKTIYIVLFLTFVTSFVFGQERKIKDVLVKGNRRIEAAAILNQVVTRAGDIYSQKDVRKSIGNIYKMGFFDDVEVDLEETELGVILTYRVKEKPSVRKIEYKGYKKVDLATLKETVAIKEYSTLDLTKIKEAKEKLVKLYEQKGFFLAQVTYSVEEDKKANEVDVIFHIEEMDKVRIRKINFIGNHQMLENRLKNVMASKEKGFLTWLTKSDNYQEDVLKGDIEGLTYYYHTQGYVQVKIDPPLVTISPDKKWIYIAISLEEGSSFDVGSVDYAGDLLFSKSELEKERKVKPQTLFNRDLLRQEVLRLADLYKDKGYAFANVNVRSNIRSEDRTVDLIFDFEKGQKVYIGNIHITGNTSTRDKVIRRELRIAEGDFYHETNIRKSIDRVRALGYFSEVNYTKPQGSSEDLVDLNISVKERSTGALQVGAGSAGETLFNSFIANAQLSHTNLFGRGHEVSLNAQISVGDHNYSRFTASFTEPYTFDSLWSSGFDAYNMETEAPNFTEKKMGGDLRLGRSVGDNINTYLTYKLEDVILKDVTDLTLTPGGGVTSSLLGTFIFDGRNNRFDPSKGFYDLVSTELAGLGGDNKFLKSIFKSRFYYPVFLDGVFRINTEFGFLTRTSDKVLPASERFFLGGINNLRGFDNLSIGPSKTTPEGKRILTGGDRQLFSNVEYELPLLPVMGVKGVLFYDVGTAFNGSNLGNIKQDVGFGFRWFSPFGPLRFEVGFPINREPGEPKHKAQIAITPPF